MKLNPQQLHTKIRRQRRVLDRGLEADDRLIRVLDRAILALIGGFLFSAIMALLAAI